MFNAAARETAGESGNLRISPCRCGLVPMQTQPQLVFGVKTPLPLRGITRRVGSRWAVRMPLTLLLKLHLGNLPKVLVAKDDCCCNRALCSFQKFRLGLMRFAFWKS